MTQQIKKAFVIGDPVGHSLSPKLHNYWLGQMNIHGKYEAIACPERYLATTIKKMADNGYVGGNVTIPHKEKIMMICDEVDDLAVRVGAVNTLVFEDGKIKGSNTDVEGFIQNVSRETSLADIKTALVLGAGGASRAVILGLQSESIEVTICNRTFSKAEKLAQEFGCEALDWEHRGKLLGYDLIVNTTSLGMKGEGTTNINFVGAKQSAVVTDIVYNPIHTEFLIAADAKLLKTIGGLGMLIHQAQPGFEKWFGQKPEINDELFHYLERALYRKELHSE